MNIYRESPDDLNATIVLEVKEDDYREKVDKELDNIRRTTSLRGFRPGKAPKGLIKNFFETKVIADKLNDVVYESLNNFLEKEKLDIIGQPLANKEKQKPFDIENQKEFNFYFDIGIKPEINIDNLSEYSVPYDKVIIEDLNVEESISYYQKQYASTKEVEAITDEAIVYTGVKELNDENNEKEGGMSIEETPFAMRVIKDEDSKTLLLGAKVGQEINLNLRKAFTNEVDLAAMLKIEKEKLDSVGDNFKLTIKKINVFEDSPLNQELFDKVFGEGKVSSEEEFRAKVREHLEMDYEAREDNKIISAFYSAFLEKNEIKLPKEFLLKWMNSREDSDIESIEKEYPQFEKSLTEQFIKNKLAEKFEISVNKQEILVGAVQFIQSYAFMSYRTYLPENMAIEQAEKMLKDENQKNRIVETVLEQKLIPLLKQEITIELKEILSEEYHKKESPGSIEETKEKALLEEIEDISSEEIQSVESGVGTDSEEEPKTE